MSDRELQSYLNMTGPAPWSLAETEFDTEGVARARLAALSLPPTYDPVARSGTDEQWQNRYRISEMLYARGALAGRSRAGRLVFGERVLETARAAMVLWAACVGKKHRHC